MRRRSRPTTCVPLSLAHAPPLFPRRLILTPSLLAVRRRRTRTRPSPRRRRRRRPRRSRRRRRATRSRPATPRTSRTTSRRTRPSVASQPFSFPYPFSRRRRPPRSEPRRRRYPLSRFSLSPSRCSSAPPSFPLPSPSYPRLSVLCQTVPLPLALAESVPTPLHELPHVPSRALVGLGGYLESCTIERRARESERVSQCSKVSPRARSPTLAPSHRLVALSLSLSQRAHVTARPRCRLARLRLLGRIPLAPSLDRTPQPELRTDPARP